MKFLLRIFLLGCLLLSQWSHLRAQSSLAESLARQLETAGQDTQRVRLLVDYAWEINEYRPDEAATRLEEAIALAKKFNFKAGEASAWNGLGVVEEIRGNLLNAKAHYLKALEIRQTLGDQRELAASFNNLGTVSESLGDYNSALDFHRQNLRIMEALRDTARIARAHFNIAGVYEGMGIYLEALDNLNAARATLEAQGDRDGLGKVFSLLGHIRYELENFEVARQWYAQSLQLYESVGDTIAVAGALADLGNALDELGNTREQPDTIQLALGYYQRSLTMYQVLDDSLGMARVFNNLGVAHKHLEQYNRALFYLRQSLAIRQRLDDRPGVMETYNSLGDVYYGQENLPTALEYTEKYYTIALEIHDTKFEQKAYKDFAKIYAQLGDYKKAFEYRVKYDELRYRRLDENRAREFDRREVIYAEDRRQREIERLEAETARRDAELARARATRNGLIGGAVALILLVLFWYNRSRLRAKANRQLASKNATIERERRRADELLMNILPEAAALELKENNSVKPVRYDSVTVLFSDFKGFTRIAEQVSPEDLIEELDECFRLFDTIVEQFGMEKIKTIGDAYMCAGGLPTPNQTHPFDVVSAAIEMQRQLHRLMEQKAAEGKPVFEMRIGIHTGPVVAGVVGSRKFAYDIWGDTVNTAARLEQGSEPHRINISGSTYAHVREHFTCTYRGEIEAKHKGAIAMYFVEY